MGRTKDLATTAAALAVDDYEDVDGTTNGSRKMLAILKHLRGDVNRLVRDCLLFDGATSHRQAWWHLGGAGALAGLPISIPFEIDVPPSGVDREIVTFTGALNDEHRANALRVSIASGGEFQIRQYGATNSDRRQFSLSAFTTTYAARKNLRGMVVFESPDSTTAPKVYFDGVDVTSGFAASTAGTPPNWMPSTLVSTYVEMARNWPTGYRAFPHGPILGALSAAEVLEWTQTGRLPTWAELSDGSGALKNTANFSGGLTSATWSPTAFSGDAAGYAEIYINGTQSNLKIGHRYKFKFAAITAGEVRSGIGTLGDVALVAGQEYDFVFNGGTQRFWSGTTGPIAASGFEFREYGPLFRPVIQPIAVVADAGANKIAGILNPGAIPVTEKRDWVIQARTSTSGNQQLLAATLVPYWVTAKILRVQARSLSGTPAVYLGTGSGGSEVVGQSFTLSTAWQELPIHSASGSLSFGAIVQYGSNHQNITVNGVALGDGIVVTRTDGNLWGDGITVEGRVTGANTVNIRISNSFNVSQTINSVPVRVFALRSLHQLAASASLWGNSNSTDIVEWEISGTIN